MTVIIANWLNTLYSVSYACADRAAALAPGDVSAGKDLDNLLWPAFYILVGCVLIAFVFTVAAPLRRLLMRMQRRFPWILIFAFCAIYSLVLAEGLLGPVIAENGAHLTMLVNGQLEAFFRLVFFPHGKFSNRALCLLTIWACAQGAIIWIGWMLLSPPQGLNRRDDRSTKG